MRQSDWLGPPQPALSSRRPDAWPDGPAHEPHRICCFRHFYSYSEKRKDVLFARSNTHLLLSCSRRGKIHVHPRTPASATYWRLVVRPTATRRAEHERLPRVPIDEGQEHESEEGRNAPLPNPTPGIPALRRPRR